MTWLAVAAGGALGSIARHAVNQFVQPSGLRFPLGITIVNLAGCLVIGWLAGSIASARIAMSPSSRDFVFVGLLGGFTTFSTFGLDTFVLLRTNPGLALLNIAVQVGGGLIAVWAGYALAATGK
jgi:CrcB protein